MGAMWRGGRDARGLSARARRHRLIVLRGARNHAVHQQIFTIARVSVLEAHRTRLPLMAIAVIGSIVAASSFVHEIAVTESVRLQSSFFAAAARLASVFMLALYITSSMVREFNEKGLELVLALDLPRSAYLIGKLLGFLGVGAILAVIATLPIMLWAPAAVCLVWGLTLFLELAIICAVSLFCIVTLHHVMPAVTVVAAFYLLSRTISAVRLVAETPLIGDLGGARPAVNFAVEGLALLLPALDRFTVTEWIAAKAVDVDVLAPIALQSAVYIALLAGASLIDFYRREL